MEDFEFILASLGAHVSLTTCEKKLIVSKLNYRRVRKREVLLSPGMIATHKMFVQNGCIRQYFVNSEGVEHTTIFGVRGYWLTDINSFLNESEAKFYIEALEDSEIIFLSKSDLEQLFEEIPKLNIFYRKLYQRAVSAKDERILNMLCSRAEERYLHFLKRYPDLETRIPQYHIASYLGVTPEFFSRMKSKLAQEVAKNKK